jgi:quinol monooxygenase YgiN
MPLCGHWPTSAKGTPMYATLRRIKTQPGQAAEVARLIEAEYLPQVEGVEGFISYTLVDLGDDEISSVGVFTSEASAHHANETAKSWTAKTLSPYVASPLEARAGSVLIDRR